MKYLGIFASLIGGYFVLIAIIELLVWRLQPNYEDSLLITTTRSDGATTTRRLARFQYDGKLYVSSNHWFRRWYYQALEHPIVDIEHDGVSMRMGVVDVTGEEHNEVLNHYDMGFALRLLCGFAPSRFLRLEPKQSAMAP